MTQPLIMSFRPDACEMCLDGRKRRTRRIWKDDPDVATPTWGFITGRDAMICSHGECVTGIESIYDTTTRRVLWEVGRPITIKPSRTAKGAGQVMCTGLRRERVRDITEEEAEMEGTPAVVVAYQDGRAEYRSAVESFAKVWRSLYPSGPRSWDENPEVVVIEFEPMEVPR
jgi:hypothetical protein